MKQRWFAGLLCLLLSTAALQGQSRESLLKVIDESPNWTPSAEPIQYDNENIESLARGQASIIKGLGLIGVTVQNWSGPSGRVRLSLYEMTDPSAAYGLFTMERNVGQPGYTPAPLGTEGYRAENRTVFWQSNYMVRLDGPSEASDDLARAISGNIFGKSQKAPVSNLLPPENLVQGTDKYILVPEALPQKLGLDPALLGFDSSVEVATGEYRVDGKSASLVLLLYPTQQIAKKFAEEWDTRSPEDAAFRKRRGPLVAVVRGSSDPGVAETLLGPVNYESQVTWNEPPPDLFLPDVILTIFTFIGIVLFFCIVIGISFGGIRVMVKKWFPDKVFDRAQDMEIIQLKLIQGVTRKELGK